MTTKSTTTTQTVVQEGVHWGWWVFWLIVFWPALIVTAFIHFGRKGKEKVIQTNTTSVTHTVE